MNNSQPNAKAGLKRLMLAIALFLGIAGMQAIAQPGGYCVTYPVADATYSACYTSQYGYYGYIQKVEFTDVATGQVVFSRSSADDGNCFYFGSDEVTLKIGKQYKVTLTGYPYYQYGNYGFYYYSRCFIDWNMNGNFSDQGEYYGSIYTSATANTGYSGGSYSFAASWTFTVPCSVQVGKTRIRLAESAYYDAGSNACYNGYVYNYPPYLYVYSYGEVEDYVLNFIPDMEAVFPQANGILLADTLYNGSSPAKPKPSATMGAVQPSGTILNYQITGPKPATTVVYEMLDPSSNSPNINMGGYKQYTAQKARGAYGLSDGSFLGTRGGEYKLSVQVSGAGCPGASYSPFTVSWRNDMAASEIISPKNNGAPRYMKYLRNNLIAVSGVFQNVGLNQVSEFWAYAYIVNSNGDTLQTLSRHWDANNNPTDYVLNSTEKVQIDFGNIRLQNIGFYKAIFKVRLESAVDQDSYNDIIPRSDDNAYTFEIAYEIQLKADLMLRPAQGEVVIGNRPVIPRGQFKNLGVYDASDVPAKLNITKTSNGALVYQSNIIVQDIPAGKYNTKVAEFDVMTLRESGTYQAELIIAHADDPLRGDDTLRTTFTVEGGLAGTYTVGAGGNFPTIDSVMNTLYYRGLAGSVTFLLTDNYYSVGSLKPTSPAWDFTTYIINLGYDATTQTTNTITWKPSQSKSISKGSVVIDLFAPNGNGIVFGQSMTPNNNYSIYYQYQAVGSIARKYVNSPGYITFDGGSQKSLKFRINSGSSATANAFYLGRGSKNITIQNVLIENGSTNLAGRTWMPMTMYNPTSGFTFQPDTFLIGATVYGYSVGIVNRSTLFGTELAQLMRVDTIPNVNNTITNNEISGFGYGIVSLGIGELLLENQGDYARFYNKNNVITNNTISNISRAGIYLGYEENAKVSGNRIFNVTNTTGSVAGIMAGGDGTSNYKGYNNVNLTLSGNEISGLSSGAGVTGIRVEQAQNSFPHPSKGVVYFPDIPEKSNISNNIVWDMTTTAAGATRAGIHLLTERGSDLWTPKVPSFKSRNDLVANNTVYVGSNGSIASTAPNVGIGLQNVNGATLKNNAVALTDMGVDAASPVYSGFFYQGVLPKDGGLTSDKNAFYAPSGANASYFRYIEVTSAGANIDFSSRYDYKSLDQWRNWTNQDKNSVTGNFLNDMVYLGTAPNQRLRINSNPYPLGSILNNRGEIISAVTADIDGNTRGTAAQNYDIGACEFNGRLYLSDVEALYIPQPKAYMAGSGLFADAEYVMTTAPVEVKALVRNSGNLQQSAITLTVNIYREQPNGLFSTTPEVTTTAVASAGSGQTIEVPFLLADGKTTEFAPKTYGELRGTGYVVPDQFLTMWANVTPKYKIAISINADQNNTNNTVEKIVRFYIRKSDMRIVTSVENSFVKLDQNSTVDQKAGRLNADTLFKALSRLGWKVDVANTRFDYDIFDRNGWEPKAVDYTMYRTMWRADANDKPLTRYERYDIENFLNTGTEIEKRNFIVSSQDIVRQHSQNDSYNDPYFVGNILRAVDKSPSNPLGVNGNNTGKRLIGVALHRNLAETISATAIAGDDYSKAGLMGISATGDGLAKATEYYETHTSAPSDSVAGVAVTTLTRNVITFGIDWRHWSRADYILRASIDFIEKNGGTIIPVELISFDAQAVGSRVDINWATASEYKTDRFEVEKAIRTDAGTSAFAKIAEEKAAGVSNVQKNYGPIVDNSVTLGRTYVYRLKMVDLTGEYKYSEEKEVKIGGENVLWLGDAKPNPVSVETTIPFSVEEAGNATIELFDLNGKLVKSLYSGSVNAGMQEITVNVNDVLVGQYNVVLKSNNKTSVRKMQVVK